MQFIQGKNRTQSFLFPQSLDQIIEAENEVRIIDLFVESINLTDFHFVIKTSKEGRPAYHPKDLLKLFVYGYLNHIRSSRQLEKECKRNIELLWLMKEFAPDHNTITNFKRNNEKAIRKVLRYTISIAKEFNLIGGKLVAGDSTKLRAQNSKKNNFNEAKIERHLAYIDAKLDEYNNALAQADDDNPQDTVHKQIIEQEIKKHEERKINYKNLSEKLEQSGEAQISTSDPASRQMMTRNNISEVAYNIQTVVDAKHNIPIDYKVTNNNDSRALSSMLRRTKNILGTNHFTALYDKGYHTGIEIKKAVELDINIMVAIPATSSNAPDENYNIEANPEVNKKRQSIAEHPYGTIKRQWGFYYIITKKGIKHASADAGFMFVAYNLRRLMNIIDRTTFTKFLQGLILLFFTNLISLKSYIFKIMHSLLKKGLTRHFHLQYKI